MLRKQRISAHSSDIQRLLFFEQMLFIFAHSETGWLSRDKEVRYTVLVY